ncbi:MAG: hypothetical protein KJ792_03045 [Actinobacteria bacterium]|nr:hypothetical protein [Actinomycetota bacterium]MCG2803358.1 hypothetical protein [Cellulomonas sp.]
MGTVIGIVVLLGVGWLIVMARDRFWKGANQHVLARNQHLEGQQLTHERLVIGSAADPDALQDAIVRGLALPYDKPAAVHAELFQGPVTPGYVQFCSGTKIMTVFTAGMRIESSGAGGSTLTYQVEKWTLSDGIVAQIPQLKFLRRHIEAEARKLDPQLEVRTDTVD